jgi:hypothetical protein
MAEVSERESIVQRARELANSGQYSDWVSIESSMRGGRELKGDFNPLDDYDFRRELDARCSAARREKGASPLNQPRY